MKNEMTAERDSFPQEQGYYEKDKMGKQINVLMEEAEHTIRSLSSIVDQDYYAELSGLPIKKISQMPYRDIAETVWLYRITMMAYDNGDGDALQKLEAVLTAVNLCGGSFLMLIEVGQDEVSFMLGVSNLVDGVDLLTLKDTLYDSLKGNFQGIQMQDIGGDIHAMEDKIRNVFENGYSNRCVTAVSGIVDAQDGSMPGLETILNATDGQIFTMLMIAEPVRKDVVDQTRNILEGISTQVSQLMSLTVGRQLADSVSKDIHITDGTSISFQEGTSNISGKTKTKDVTEDKERNITDYLLQTASTFAALTGNLPIAYGLKMTGELGHMGDGRDHAESEAEIRQTSENYSKSDGKTHQESKGESRGVSSSESLQYTIINRSAKQLYDKIERFLVRLDNMQLLGMMNVSTYIMSSSGSVNINVASRYNAMLGTAGGRLYGVNTWTGDAACEIKKYLMCGRHPVLSHYEFGEVSPAVMMSGKELARQLALPKETVSGISVGIHARFARKVVFKPDSPKSPEITVGNIFHMGSDVKENSVCLSFHDLVSHCLVGGACGIGKTTAVCSMLTKLYEQRIPFLVIEPAKGEYKKVLAGLEDIHIYSPMPAEQKTDALKLNLFWFREGIDPCEHIEKLKEIFCACWPMYAAMPQILNTALCNAYIKCGWNLRTKKNAFGRIFPSLRDVCDEVKNAISISEFSTEVKGNYIGSLLSRLESLNEGIYEQIFSGGNLEDEALFLENVILDLSRPDAAEVKALITGTVIMRLFEYCTNSGEIPEERVLKHVTVLEEAHNLLGRVKAASEGADMREKSVEMFTRCITELGGYGRGFLIADQSPGALCEDVIKNTNTKMVFNLPYADDAACCGSAMGLSAEQTKEIAELGRGICVIKQTSWEEPVLCHIQKHIQQRKERYASSYCPLDGIREYLYCLLAPYSVLGKEKPVIGSGELEKAKEWAYHTNRSIHERRKFYAAVGKKSGWKTCVEIVNSIVDRKALFGAAGEKENVEEWTQAVTEAIRVEYTDDYLIALTVVEALLFQDGDREYADRWFDLMKPRRKKGISLGKNDSCCRKAEEGL